MSKKKFFTIFSVLVILAIFLGVYFKLIKDEISYTPQKNLNAPIEITENLIVKYDDSASYDKPVLLLFYVDWCTYCRKFMPIFGELAKKYKDKYTFAVANCDEEQNINIAKKFHIAAFPSLFVVDKEIKHKFSMPVLATAEKSILIEELDSYLNVKKHLGQKNTCN